ncbi:hypothetical protein [Miltoncostaea oceani]|uniref:hypothetical protein n=1 Tax=Miltoncostaea oceani TaxID=2843216 RepID=UPI001C3DBEF9|nr:hypothetical protein [Miltoncostaea oceani]
MKKPLEQLISEFLEEHPGATLYVRKDLLGYFEIGVSGENHVHSEDLVAGLRAYWAGVGLAEPACAISVEG